ncbi:NAD(P)-dependent oxidoreductase [Leptolyngbyaceae cyanobacterium CCMR0082]|uniref:NAD(P)-dependent oxidoreductase n=2 Tax=Adonisia turfae TaxID=2950184 RepID=A0A6M0S6Y0_9CYAN|nr:NAD(P)-dependent oxidoreductase [Adonisia turfae]MDV3351053.1 NAD(P)-dependent oxidoreductase [Leptothoe sp. LEGE 181152]NEZ57410.1 NAD(P)-dependent oxidoreductase [Adonisia turfae CCMR0081]NEZ64204.1 NAD(P)-dependent oxidoreductase [Adonisia turfae CCMR0082]
MKVAFIGLGTMGMPMALNLLATGHQLIVHNRSRDRELPLVEAGAQRAATPAAAATEAEIIVICVSDTPDVEAVLLGPEGVISGAQPNSLVIDMSTISPTVTRAIAAELAEQQIAMLDAPVSGGSEGATNGTLSIMVGGEAEALTKAMPVLQALGKTITHVGPIGAGQTTKAINQIVVAGTFWAVAEGLALGLKAELDMEKVVQAVGGGAASSWAFTNRSGNMLDNTYPLGFRMRLHRKDLLIALEAARELGLPLPMAAYVEQIESGLIAQGFGDEDMSAIARSLREMGGI